MTDHPAGDGLSFLAGGGRVGSLLRTLDWSGSPLGHPSGWPQSLRGVIRLMLTIPSPMAIYWGLQRAYLYNDAMAELIGAERHPASLGRPGAEVWSEIWDEVISPQLDHVMRGKGGLRHREQLLRMTRNGSVQDTWWNYSQTPIYDPDSSNGIRGVLILGVEVTAYRTAREIATAERSKLLSMFESSASFVAMLEGPDHRFTLANKSFRDLVGRPNLVGRTVLEAVPEVREQGFVSILDEVYSTGQPFVALGVNVELKRNANEGRELRRLNFSYHRIESDDGEIVGVLTEGQDVTEALETQEQLLAKNEALSAILKYSPDLICAVNVLGECTMVSDSARVILDYDPDELVGRKFGEFVIEDDATKSARNFQRLIQDGAVRHFENRLLRKDGAVRTIRWAAAYSPDRATVFAAGRDVTEMLAIEKQLRQAQKLEAVGRTTAGVAHDFNNLLTVISTAAEGLVDGAPLDSEAREQVGLILSSADRGAELVKRLVAFSRGQSLSPEPIQLSALLEGLRPLLERGLGGSVRLNLVPPPPSLRCLADVAQLEAALFNLCLNARDAMPDGGEIRVWMENETITSERAQRLDVSPGEFVAINVRDTGHGMTSEILERAAEPFFTTKAVGKGSGLGLSMNYGFARQSGGQLTLRSPPGEGLTVTLHLPLASGDLLPASANPSGEDQVAAAPADSFHILVVEDDDHVRASVVSQMRRLGYRVSHAGTGAAAIEVLGRGENFDLLFTDVELSGSMSGRQLADQARALQPDIGLILTSGYTEDDFLSRGTRPQSRWTFLAKPYRRHKLEEAVRAALSASE